MAITITKAVRPTPKWQEMYLKIKQDQRVIIAAEGLWSPDLRNTIGWCGPDGIVGRIAGEGYLMPGTNVGALIMKIGKFGPVAVGNYYDFKSLVDGVLFLAINDNPEYHDQAGVVHAQIILFDVSGKAPSKTRKTKATPARKRR